MTPRAARLKLSVPSPGTLDSEDSIFGVLDSRANALGLGETDMTDVEHYTSFGAPSAPTADVVKTSHAACLLVQSLGCPRELSTEWLFGA